jgi:hypothetical protein
VKNISTRLLLFSAANVLLLNVALPSFSPPDYRETVLLHSYDTLTLRSRADSWKPMGLALAYIESGATEPLYSELLIRQHRKFQYPPSALLALQAARSITGSNESALSLLRVVGVFFVVVMAGATAAILDRGLPPAASRGEAVVRVGVVAFLTLTFYPFVKSCSLGQIQVWINALFAVILWCWMTGRKVTAGLLLAIPCLIKPQYALLLPWALLKGERRLAASCAAVVAVGLGASISQYGWANHLDYLEALSFISRRGEAFFPNQSVNGLMNRLWSIEYPDLYNNLYWGERYFPPYTPWIYGATLISSALLLVTAFSHPRARADTRGFCIIILSATMASPIAWDHHYGILLPLYAVLLPALIREGRGAGGLIVLGVSYVLTSNFISVANVLAASPFNVFQSYLFAGALAVLLLFYGSKNESVA